MSAIINVGSTPAILPFPSAPVRQASVVGDSTIVRGGAVEFSQLGRAALRGAELSSFSLARVRAIREELANGTYETPERIGGTVERLLDVLA